MEANLFFALELVSTSTCGWRYVVHKDMGIVLHPQNFFVTDFIFGISSFPFPFRIRTRCDICKKNIESASILPERQ
jgi:hypothetical protein